MLESQLKIQELSDPDSELARQAFAIYENAFPAEERVPIEHIAAMIRKRSGLAPTDRVKHFWIALNDSTVMGIAIFSYHRDLRLAFLEYIAIHPSARGQGYGSRLFLQVVEQTTIDSTLLGGPDALGVCFEVERTLDASTEAERQIRERRIRFYQRNGTQLIDHVEFLAPSLGKDLPPVPYYLMFRPTAKGPVALTFEDIESIVETVLLRGYGVQRDSTYFQQAIDSIHHRR